MNVAPSSPMLCSRVRNLSVTLLTRLRAEPTLRSTFAPTTSREAIHTRARLHPALPEHPSLGGPASLPRCVLPRSPCGGLTGSLRLRVPTTPANACFTRPPRAALRQLADRPGLPLPALLVACICQPCFRLDRPWAPHLQRLLPARAVPSLRPAETGFPRPRTILPAVSRRPPTACLATDCLRCDAAAPRIQARLLMTHLAARRGYPNGCVLLRRRCSRPRRVAPLLVVTPLRG